MYGNLENSLRRSQAPPKLNTVPTSENYLLCTKPSSISDTWLKMFVVSIPTLELHLPIHDGYRIRLQSQQHNRRHSLKHWRARSYHRPYNSGSISAKGCRTSTLLFCAPSLVWLGVLPDWLKLFQPEIGFLSHNNLTLCLLFKFTSIDKTQYEIDFRQKLLLQLRGIPVRHEWRSHFCKFCRGFFCYAVQK